MKTLLLLCMLTMATLRSLPCAEELLSSALSSWSKAHDITFTLEYLSERNVGGAWRSVQVSDTLVTTPDEDMTVARKKLESSLPEWVVVPSHLYPRVWHLIDRSLLTRSPMDGRVSALDFHGYAANLVDALAKDPGIHVLAPTFFAPGDMGSGARIDLTGFNGRIRDALTISYGAGDPLRPVIQWVAECFKSDNGELTAPVRLLPTRKVRAKPSEPAAAAP